MIGYFEFERKQTIRVYFKDIPDKIDILNIQEGEMFDVEKGIIDWDNEEVLDEDYSYYNTKRTFNLVLDNKDLTNI